MKTGCVLGNWSRWLAAGLVVWAFAVYAPGLVAQTPRSGTQIPPTKTARRFYNQAKFSLPIAIEDQFKPLIQEVALFVKRGNSSWKKEMAVSPYQKQFTYHAPQDGEYAFSVVTIDKAGNSTPADVSKEPPVLVVVIDTKAPEARIKVTKMPHGQKVLQCTILDAHPDYKSLKISYLGSNNQLHSVAPVSGVPGVFSYPSKGIPSGRVRYAVMDLAKNKSEREVFLQTGGMNPNPLVQNFGNPPANFNGVKNMQGPEIPPPPPPPSQGPELFPPRMSPGKINVAKNDYKVLKPEANPPISPELKQIDYKTTITPPKGKQAKKPLPIPMVPNETPAIPFAGTNRQPRQLIRTLLAEVLYKINKVGPSGVSKVDIWMKPEANGPWKQAGTDVDLRSPAKIQLPGEGVFGIRLAVTNGNGFGGRAPQPADPADFYIEVDTTPPFAQLHPVDPVTNGKEIAIRWKASDKNLGENPITILYATRRGGPWLPIAEQVPNSGEFKWQFPVDAGSEFFVRLEIQDKAGNVTRRELPAPIVLDLTEPRALVVGVSGVSVQPAFPK